MPLKKFYVIGHGIVFVPYIQKVFGKRATQLSSQFDSVILILVKTRSLFLFPSFITIKAAFLAKLFRT